MRDDEVRAGGRRGDGPGRLREEVSFAVAAGRLGLAVLPSCRLPLSGLRRPGGDLLSHAFRRSTIGAEGFHGRVRDGIGCGPLAMTTRPAKAGGRKTEGRRRKAEDGLSDLSRDRRLELAAWNAGASVFRESGLLSSVLCPLSSVLCLPPSGRGLAAARERRRFVVETSIKPIERLVPVG